MRRRILRLGWRGLLALVTGLTSLAGCGGEPQVLYGPLSTCNSDADCAPGLYCDQSDRRCAPSQPDAGLDAGAK